MEMMVSSVAVAMLLLVIDQHGSLSNWRDRAMFSSFCLQLRSLEPLSSCVCSHTVLSFRKISCTFKDHYYDIRSVALSKLIAALQTYSVSGKRPMAGQIKICSSVFTMTAKLVRLRLRFPSFLVFCGHFDITGDQVIVRKNYV